MFRARLNPTSTVDIDHVHVRLECHRYLDGSFYEGYCHGGKPDGFGVFRSSQGFRYIGRYVGGERRGLGALIHPSGKIWAGVWNGTRLVERRPFADVRDVVELAVDAAVKAHKALTPSASFGVPGTNNNISEVNSVKNVAREEIERLEVVEGETVMYAYCDNSHLFLKRSTRVRWMRRAKDPMALERLACTTAKFTVEASGMGYEKGGEKVSSAEARGSTPVMKKGCEKAVPFSFCLLGRL